MEKVKGVISLALPGPGIIGGYWALYFTDKRILVVELEGILDIAINFAASKAGAAIATDFVLNKVTRNRIIQILSGAAAGGIVASEMKKQIKKQVEIAEAFVDESPADLLASGGDNFSIQYKSIKSLELKKAGIMSGNKISISCSGKKYDYDLMNKVGGVDSAGFKGYIKVLQSALSKKLTLTSAIL